MTVETDILSEPTKRRGRPTKGEIAQIAPQILDAALHEFLSVGYDHANMSVIASSAGCSKRTLYARFSSKLALFVACVSSMAERRLESIQASTSRSESIETRLTEIAGMIMAASGSEEIYSLHRLLVQDGPRFPELRAAIEKQAWKPVTALVRELLRSHFAEASEEDLAYLADHFLAMTGHRILLHQLVGDKPVNDTPERTVKLFLGGCMTSIASGGPQ